MVGVIGKKQWWVLQQCNCRQFLGILERTHSVFTKYRDLFLMKTIELKISKKFFLHFTTFKFTRKKKVDEEAIQKYGQC